MATPRLASTVITSRHIATGPSILHSRLLLDPNISMGISMSLKGESESSPICKVDIFLVRSGGLMDALEPVSEGAFRRDCLPSLSNDATELVARLEDIPSASLRLRLFDASRPALVKESSLT